MTGWQEQVAENARRYGELNERLSRASITETSRDGMVRVTVSADGSLTDLALAERRQSPPMAELAEQIMTCVRRARARIPDLVGRTMAETVGTGDEAADLILADAHKRFPAPPPEPDRGDLVEEVRIGGASTVEPPGPRVRRPPVRHEVDDGWDERPVLRDV